MVRTKADGGGGGAATRKAVAARAPRKALGSSTSSSVDGSSPSGNKYAGGNPVCVRPTPEWQKSISKFFNPGTKTAKENTAPETVGSSDVVEAGGSGASGS